MNYKELELKYRADGVALDEFKSLVHSYNPEWVNVSSYDDYFTNDANEFIRYRYHDNMGQLTIKRKTVDANNNNRIEVNIDTEPKGSKNIAAFVSLLGYRHNFSIFKTCHIAFLEKVVLVYYITYDKNMNELDRFLEIEANEKYRWQSEEQAWAEVLDWEKKFEIFGITSRNRLKKSLFELYKK